MSHRKGGGRIETCMRLDHAVDTLSIRLIDYKLTTKSDSVEESKGEEAREDERFLARRTVSNDEIFNLVRFVIDHSSSRHRGTGVSYCRLDEA